MCVKVFVILVFSLVFVCWENEELVFFIWDVERDLIYYVWLGWVFLVFFSYVGIVFEVVVRNY